MSDDADDQFLDDRLGRYSSTHDQSKIRKYFERLGELFNSEELTRYVLGPFYDELKFDPDTTADQVRGTITTTAVVNAVMAGLPGKMGIGVAVSMALEAWMAYKVAQHVGIELKDPVRDGLKYLGVVGAVTVTILWLFRQLLGWAFSLFSLILPGVNPMIPAELVVTNVVGILFWVGFDEAKRTGSFRVPRRTLAFVTREAWSLLKFQMRALRGVLNFKNNWRTAQRLIGLLRGEIEMADQVTDDTAVGIAAAALLEGHFEALDGPVGKEFLESIRDLYPELQDASTEEIASAMREYTSEQLPGVLSNVKGRLFERLVELSENEDGDNWSARLHEDRTYPGTDLIIENSETGEAVEISLKATDSKAYIENALSRYPDADIWTTEEVAQDFSENPDVVATHFSNRELTTVTEENFEQLVDELSNMEVVSGAGGGAATGATISLWPFVVAYLRKRITKEQLEEACVRVLGKSGIRLTANIVGGVVLGPVYLWFTLARTVAAVTQAAGVET